MSRATTPERTTSGTRPPWKSAGEDHRRLRVEREDDGTAESIEQAVTEGKPLRAVLKRWLQPRGIGFLRLVGYPNTADVFVHASTLPEDPTGMVGHTLMVQIQRDSVHSAKSQRATHAWWPQQWKETQAARVAEKRVAEAGRAARTAGDEIERAASAMSTAFDAAIVCRAL